MAGSAGAALNPLNVPRKFYFRSLVFKGLLFGTAPAYCAYRFSRWYYRAEECDSIAYPDGSVFRVGVTNGEGPPPTFIREKRVPELPVKDTGTEYLERILERHYHRRRKLHVFELSKYMRPVYNTTDTKRPKPIETD